MKNIQIRETNKSDLKDIIEVEKKAFGHEDEAELVNQLLSDKSAAPVISLLAFYQNEAIGHILFTKATLDGATAPPLIYLLAPLAVKPAFQRQGIGGMLINEGLKKLNETGAEMVFVLGHADYYPKYGFLPGAGSMGYDAPYPIPEEHANAWMVQAISSTGLSKIKGRVICADSISKPEYWRE